MNEPVPAWIEWSPTGITWGMGEQPFPDERLADLMANHRYRAATIAPKRRLPQRICLHPGCTTILSQYNRDSDFCGAHLRYHSRVAVPA